MNARWWKLVGDLQGVAPPSPRSEAFCDAGNKEVGNYLHTWLEKQNKGRQIGWE